MSYYRHHLNIVSRRFFPLRGPDIPRLASCRFCTPCMTWRDDCADLYVPNFADFIDILCHVENSASRNAAEDPGSDTPLLKELSVLFLLLIHGLTRPLERRPFNCPLPGLLFLPFFLLLTLFALSLSIPIAVLVRPFGGSALALLALSLCLLLTVLVRKAPACACFAELVSSLPSLVHSLPCSRRLVDDAGRVAFCFESGLRILVFRTQRRRPSSSATPPLHGSQLSVALIVHRFPTTHGPQPPSLTTTALVATGLCSGPRPAEVQVTRPPGRP